VAGINLTKARIAAFIKILENWQKTPKYRGKLLPNLQPARDGERILCESCLEHRLLGHNIQPSFFREVVFLLVDLAGEKGISI